jgi:hypothetical protein
LTEKKGSATRQRGMGERIFEGRICNKRKCEGTLMMGDRGVRGEEQEQEQEKKKRRRDLEGIAVLAWLPSGSVSGHFIHPASSTCLGLFGTEIPCERECSRGEDHRLLNFTILDFTTRKETSVVVERRGLDAARLSSACDIHGWEEELVRGTGNPQGVGEQLPVISFECETLKADNKAEQYIKQFFPSLVGLDAVVNIGTMTIKGLQLDASSSVLVDPPYAAEAHACTKDLNLEPVTKRANVDLWKLVDEELKAEGLTVDNNNVKKEISSLLETEQNINEVTVLPFNNSSNTLESDLTKSDKPGDDLWSF